MPSTPARLTAQAAGTFDLGGDLTINRLGYGTIQLTGPGYWGDPKDPDEAVRVPRSASSSSCRMRARSTTSASAR